MKKMIVIAIIFIVAVSNGSVHADSKNTEKMKKTRSETFIQEKNVEWETIGDGVKRQILGYDGQLMMVKIKAEKKGPVGVEHAHYHSQVTFVSSGKFEFTINGEKKIVSAGDGMYMEPEVRHSCICIEPGIIVDCFSPIREDFLKK
jgi:quercetin dioxygenase-like cupin family protein